MTTIIDQARYLIMECDKVVCDPDANPEAFTEAYDDLNVMLHALPPNSPEGALAIATLALADDIRTDIME